MPSTYTTNNGIELIATGEQTGTWGSTTNTNLSLVDTSLDGHVSVSLAVSGTSGSPNTLPITDGSASNGRNRAIIFTDSGDLGADAYVQLTPNDAKKIMFVRNSLSGSRNLILFQGTYNASNDFVLAVGKDAIVKFNGAGSGAVASAVLADFALDAATIGTADINGGTIDGVSIGASAVATIINVDNLSLNGNTISSTNTNGNITLDPNGTGVTDVVGTIRSDGADLDGAVVINESGASVDFRVESDTLTHALFVQGSDGRTALGSTTAPLARLEVSRLGGATPTITGGLTATTALFVHSGPGVASSGVDITLVGGNTSNTIINFGDTDNADIGRIIYNNNVDAMSFVVNGSTALALTSGLDVQIQDKIVHSGDTNTAIRFPAADTVTVETTGSERLRVSSAGGVGVGTNGDALSRLEVALPAGQVAWLTRAAGDAGVTNPAMNFALSSTTGFMRSYGPFTFEISAVGGTPANALSIADSTGVVTIGSSVLTTTDINGGTIDAVTLGTNSAVTEAQIDNININGNTISSTNTNGNIAITPDGTGEVDISKVDINGGAIDGTVIGGASAAAGTFTTLDATGDVSIADKIIHTGDTNTAIRFPSADVVSVETGGTERIRVTDKALQFPNTYTTFTDYWTSGGALLTGLGYLGTNGSFAVSLYANGYRNTSSGFTYMGADGNTNTASGIDLLPTGEIQFRGGTASGTALPLRGRFLTDGTFASGAASLNGAVVINDSGADVDFRVESDTLTHALFVQGSDGNVGVNNATPDVRLHVTESATSYSWTPSASTEFILERNGDCHMTLAGSATGESRINFATVASESRARISFARSTDLLQMVVDGNTGFTMDASANVGIGTTSPATKFHVNGTIRYTNRPAAGTITAIGFDTNGDIKASSSSLRYKHDIKDYDKGLAEVMQLRPVSFKFNGEDIENIGFIAEEVDTLGLIQVLTYNEERQPEGVQYANMVSLLTKAIQQQQALIARLETRIAVLEATSTPVAATPAMPAPE